VPADSCGPKEELLATLGMIFTIAPCREEDLQRAEELTVRTNQLNTTGYTYSYEELDALRQSGRRRLPPRLHSYMGTLRGTRKGAGRAEGPE
jgi:hypothetical protein